MPKFLHALAHDRLGTFKFAILTHPLFIAGLLAKIYAAALFAGENFTTLFIPFLKYFLTSGFQDPYAYFYGLGITEVFPYPQLMLFIMAIPGLLFWPLLHHDIFTTTTGDLLIFQLPILLADIVILLVLARWLQNRHRTLLILYWLSPILFYINYLHVQLDVIPIAFVFLFLHYLFKERWLIAFLFLGASIATKFHIAVLLPFIAIYLWHKQHQGRLVALMLVATAGLFTLINNTQLLSSAFTQIVFQNREQGKIFDQNLTFADGSVLFLLPFAYALLFLHGLSFRRFNRDTFVMFLGFSFGLLTLFIPPMPGWYYWVVPFLIYFCVKHDRFPKLLFMVLTAAYFGYFALRPDSDFFALFSFLSPTIASLPNLYYLLEQNGLPAALASNSAFTLLQASLLINVLWLYRRGLEESKKTKLYSMPYLIGIAGDSGSGKSTLTSLLTAVFGSKNVAVVAGDAMHKWERGNEMWQKFTHLDPKANALHEDLEHALRLRDGNDTHRRHYDHHSGTFTAPERLESKKLILFEGLHSFFLTPMRRALDLKVFIMPEEQLRIHWKLLRDMKERGYTREKVLDQLKKRERDSLEYIATQERYADITITLRAEQELGDAVGTDTACSLFLEIKCDNAVNMDKLLGELAGTTLTVEHRYCEQSQLIRFCGEIAKGDVERISLATIPEVYELTTEDPVWTDGYNGIMQLFLCYYVLQSLRLERHDYS